MHRHYSYYWHRCRECGRPAGDCSEYCDDCADELSAQDEAQQEAQQTAEDAEIAAQIAADAAEAAEADAVPAESVCSCIMPYVPSNALYSPEPILDRYCPIHGDGGPDPDRALEERLDQIREDRNQ